MKGVCGAKRGEEGGSEKYNYKCQFPSQGSNLFRISCSAIPPLCFDGSTTTTRSRLSQTCSALAQTA